MCKRVRIFILFLFIVQQIHAQLPDTVLTIQGVEITADKISRFASGIKIQKIDSTILTIRLGTTMATLLNEQMPVYIRSYGPGGLSTLSMRGTNASQSGVFWNGINLNQPNIGQADLSRISTFDFTNISLQSGSASALLGSGILGGSLHVSNNLVYLSPVKTAVMISGASFGNIKGAVKIAAGGNKVAYSGSLSGDWNENSFWYNTHSGESKRLEHALVKSISTIHQAEMIVNSKQRLSAGFWYQITHRQIPPTMTMISSDQNQWDQAIRSSLQWSYVGKNQACNINTAFIDEQEHYTNQSANIDAFYHINTYQGSFDYKKYFRKYFTLGGGVASHLIKADVPYYQQVSYQNDVSLWLALAFSGPESGIKSALNLRQDFSKGYQIPFCPALNIEVPVSKRFATSFAVSKNFRIPNMNDKYWIPGGNPDLKPESSWNFEAGVSYGFMRTKYSESNFQVNFYSNIINDFIQWVPGEANIWSPQNLSKVWSRGVEVTSKSDWHIYGFKGYFTFGYNYSPSTFEGETENEGDQLIYTPLHKISEVFYLSKENYYALISYSFTSLRFVVSDNSKSLPGYSLLNLQTGYNFKMKKSKLRVQFEINNLMNTEYQSAQYYPEPGRSYVLNLLYTNN